ncbi:hypothetical protein C8R47DRAFT_1071163 [Mycena vitilis]|nr:hypothetical protein C8R47DRAFT_1071163 [Mycena vitilis]
MGEVGVEVEGVKGRVEVEDPRRDHDLCNGQKKMREVRDFTSVTADLQQLKQNYEEDCIPVRRVNWRGPRRVAPLKILAAEPLAGISKLNFEKQGKPVTEGTIGRGTPKNQNLKPEPHRIRKNVLVHGIWDSKSERNLKYGVEVWAPWIANSSEAEHYTRKRGDSKAVRGKSIRGLKAVGAALRRLPDALDMRERTIRLNELVGDKAFGAASRRPSDPLNTRELKIRLNELQERATCLPAAKSPGKKAALEREKMPSSQTERLAPPGLKHSSRERDVACWSSARREAAPPPRAGYTGVGYSALEMQRACRRPKFQKKRAGRVWGPLTGGAWLAGIFGHGYRSKEIPGSLKHWRGLSWRERSRALDIDLEGISGRYTETRRIQLFTADSGTSHGESAHPGRPQLGATFCRVRRCHRVATLLRPYSPDLRRISGGAANALRMPVSACALGFKSAHGTTTLSSKLGNFLVEIRPHRWCSDSTEISRGHPDSLTETFLKIQEPRAAQGWNSMRNSVSHEFRCPDILGAVVPILIHGGIKSNILTRSTFWLLVWPQALAVEHIP